MNDKTLTFFTGAGCHLCEQARLVIDPVLAEEGWLLREVDIRGDAQLEEAYGLRIPVVKTSTGAEKGWPFSAGQVRRLLRDSC